MDEELGNKNGISGSLNNIGQIYERQGKYDEAIDYYSQSLEIDEENNNVNGMAVTIGNIGWIYERKGNFGEAKKYFDRGLEISEESGDQANIASALNNIGWIYEKQGNYAAAIEHFTRGLKMNEEIGDKSGVALTLNNIAMIYNNQEDYDNTIKYAIRSLRMWEEMDNQTNITVLLNNIGRVFTDQGNFTKAMEYFNQSLQKCEEIGQLGIKADVLNNIGRLYSKQNDLQKAREFYSRSLELYETLGDRASIASVLINLGGVHYKESNYTKTIKINKQAMEMAKEAGALRSIKLTSEALYKSYKQIGNDRLALQMYETFIDARDSLESEKNQRAIIRQEYKYAYEKQAMADSIQYAQEQRIVQAELNTQKQRNYFFLGGFSLALFFGGFTYNRFRVTQRQKGIIEDQKKRVESERDKSDRLLLNILPKDTADELKEKGTVATKSYEMASVLFIDIIKFTELSTRMSPEQLVEELNFCFSEFDRIVEKYGVEKIKTIGDAYMAAAGVPIPSATHAEDTISAALEINAFIQQYVKEKEELGAPHFQVRIGIHSGPLVAGVVGTNKFQYDVWGDTVNLASRVENNSIPDKVNISQTTYGLIHHKDDFIFENRGKIEVKGKGEMGMYFVTKV